MAVGSVLGAGCGFAASYFVSHSGTFFVLFLGAIIGSGVGELLYRVMGRRASPVVGAITALDFWPASLSNRSERCFANLVTADHQVSWWTLGESFLRQSPVARHG